MLLRLACMLLQLGGLALHEGQVAEMATGEGKTLVATLPAYLNALTGAWCCRPPHLLPRVASCSYVHMQLHRLAIHAVPLPFHHHLPAAAPGAAATCAHTPTPPHCTAGRSVHIITVNDYLAKRDAEWCVPWLGGCGWVGERVGRSWVVGRWLAGLQWWRWGWWWALRRCALRGWR